MTEELQILNEIEKAAQLCEQSYTHNEIISVMKTENDFEKQICMLKLNKLQNQEEAELLVFQLTGHHGLIREAAAIKINEFIDNPKYTHFFLTDYILESLLKGINDINPNICRMLCSILPVLFSNNADQKAFFLKNLYSRFFIIFDELEKLKRSTWYTKKLFNLYWCLEALKLFAKNIPTERIYPILSRASKEKEYTIREKVAQIVIYLSDNTFTDIKKELSQDENYYVRAVFDSN